MNNLMNADLSVRVIGLSMAFLVAVTIIFIAYIRGRSAGRNEEREKNKQDALYLRQEIKKLQAQADVLNKLNNRYLTFMVNVSTIIRRLNTTVKFQEIISSINRLVRDVIYTDKVEIYIFHKSDGLLRKVSSSGTAQEGQISFSPGEGLVGSAAQDRMVKTIDHSDQKNTRSREVRKGNSQLWMAVPIIFNDRLFGVIGIGKVKKPMGNEANLMKIIADITGIALTNQSLLGEAQQEANTDPLTGLYNRRYFFQMAQNYVEKTIKEDSLISIFLFDIDHFKHFNDNNGHGEGDLLLKELSRLTLLSAPNSSVITRYGGEEFIIMFPGISKEEAFACAERLRETICSHPFANRDKQPLGCVSISGGIAGFPADGDSIQKVVRIADAALYQAKSEGRNRVIMHTPFFFHRPKTEKKTIRADNRRKDKRFLRRCEVEFTSNETTYRGISSNFSLNGLFIRADRPFIQDTMLDIVIHLPDDSTSKIKGRVRWTSKILTAKILGSSIATLRNGMGIELMEKDAGYLHFIESLVADFEYKTEETSFN